MYLPYNRNLFCAFNTLWKEVIVCSLNLTQGFSTSLMTVYQQKFFEFFWFSYSYLYIYLSNYVLQIFPYVYHVTLCKLFWCSSYSNFWIAILKKKHIWKVERERDCPYNVLSHKWSQMPGLFCHICVCVRGPNIWAIFSYFSRYIRRELEQKWKS